MVVAVLQGVERRCWWMEGDGAARMRGRNGSRRVGVNILMISRHFFLYLYIWWKSGV